jgi:hypothetical protein
MLNDKNSSSQKIALSNLLQHFWAYLIDNKGKERNTYEYLDEPDTLPLINALFAEPSPRPELIKGEMELLREVIVEAIIGWGFAGNGDIGEYADCWLKANAAKVELLFQRQESERLKEANEVLRSCYSVAERHGVSTNWEPLIARIKKVLADQHKVMYPASSPIEQQEGVKTAEQILEAKGLVYTIEIGKFVEARVEHVVAAMREYASQKGNQSHKQFNQ